MKELRFDQAKEGRVYTKIPLSGELLQQTIDQRCQMIDLLSGHDDALADAVINNDSLENIGNDLVMSAIRRATIQQKIVPVVLGSAYKKTGVQPLIDSVIAFLPTPTERCTAYECFGYESSLYFLKISNIVHYFILSREKNRQDFAGKVFKVMHDKEYGPLSLVRILNGTLKKGDKVTNTKSGSESIQRIFEPLADEYREIHSVSVGNVGVCAGLKVWNLILLSIQIM